MSENKRRTPTPIDPGLALIDRYVGAIVQSRMEHLSTGGYAADAIEVERAIVEALAGRIGDALRLDYLARSFQP